MRWRARSRDAPLSTEAVVGWRAWSVTERNGEPRLSSLTRREEWEPGSPIGASCTRRRHAAPGRLCSCGVYAGAEPEELARLGRIAGAAIGQVSMWGRVVEHEQGIRAAFAYPARLRLVCVACLSEGRGTPASRVDLDSSTGLDKLAPLCEEHAAGRSLPPAAAVERSLLSVYLVDLLPDEALQRIEEGDAGHSKSPAVRRSIAVMAVFVLLCLGVARGWVDRHAEPIGASMGGPVPAQRDTSGAYLPFDRTNDGVVSTIWSRVLLLSPNWFDVPRCGRRTSRGVTHVECKDATADLFVGDVVGVTKSSARDCGPDFTATTHPGQRIVCWRPLPAGGAGSGRTFLD
jgi:hypothetical protein